MASEMSARERLEAVIRLELPDRVPVGGWFDAFCAVSAGITLEEWVFDPDKAESAFYRTAELLGGYDVAHRPPPGGAWEYKTAFPTKMILPGRELPASSVWQLDEAEFMAAEDYDFILAEGFAAYQKIYAERIGAVPEPGEVEQTARRQRENAERCRAAGIEPIVSVPAGANPFNFFATARSLNGFMSDLHRRPEKVLAVCDAVVDGIIAKALENAGKSPVKRVMIGGARAASDFISPRMAARFYMPYLKKAVYALLDAGITPILHLDNNFGPLLHHLLEYPRGTCLLQLDGFTDIFQAKELLGGHMAIMGDVPPTLLTLGTPEEVTAYCRKLIEVVGKNGGFILAAGCTVPMNAKLENVRAMVDAAKLYGRYS